MRRIACLCLLAVAVLVARAPLAAQVGATTDVLTGIVTGPAGEPLSGVRVAVMSLETGISRSAITNAQGRFTLVFPDGGGHYRLQASYLGMAPVVREVSRLADEDVLLADIRMDILPVAIEGVQVTARRGEGVFQGEPGSQERVLSGEALNRLPVDPNDLASIATLTPGVVSLEGGDSLGLAVSVLGQGPAANQVTLDGLSFSGGEGFGGGSGLGVPQEAVRFTRVVTNTYDVARGQFSGGQIATTTRSGTNQVQGSLSYSLRDPALQWTDGDSPFAGALRQQRFSGGIGGPIVRDRLFYFGSLSVQRRSEGLRSLLSADPAALLQLGASPDSVQRFLSLLSGLGVAPAAGSVPDNRVGDSFSSLIRLDFNLNDRHTLTLRGDGRWSEQDGFRSGPLGLPTNGGGLRNSAGGVMTTLTSRFGNGWINEFRAYASLDRRRIEPSTAIPEGRVQVSSVLDDGARAVSTLSFGGSATALDATERGVEISDELSLLLGSTHRIRLGGVLNWSESSQESESNVFGTFAFNSLEDFAAGRPASFTRSLSPRERQSGGVNAALYLGDSWRPSQRLQLTYGARLEGSGVDAMPEYNPRVEALFGRRTDQIPSEVRISPRVGFSYTLDRGEGGQPAGVIRGGFGEFRARPPWSLFAAAREATGLPGTSAQLFCVGDAVPLPDWTAFALDPSSIPAACEGEVTTRPLSGSRSGVTVFDPDFAAPRSWRASLGVQRRLSRTAGMSLDFTYAEGVGQRGLRDLNLNPTAQFQLAGEAGRPVFAPPEAVVPGTGEVAFLASRLFPELGQVQEVHSDLRSRTTQLALSLNGAVPSLRLFLQGSYTYARSRDQGSGGGWGFGRFGFGGGGGGIGSLGTTAGNPNEPEWATSDFERPHSLVFTVGRPIRPWMDLSVIGRATSGTSFTPLVGGDINGDGARNDQAFIFDPARVSDPSVAAGMERLLSHAPERARACLQEQLGRIAARNSCRGPWSYSLDVRANLRPEIPAIGRRLTVSVSASNTLAGLDRLLHGEDDLRGWGQFIRPDPVLLYPRGFDPGARGFRYEVNERFGDSRQGLAFRNPFQVFVEGRMTVGRERQGGPGGFGGGGFRRGGGPGGPGGGGAAPAAGATGPGAGPLAQRATTNPIRGILQLSDSLGLSPEQASRLEILADSLQARQEAVQAAMRERAGQAGAGQDRGEAFRAMQPRLAELRTATQEALAEAQRILTAEQWTRVPDALKTLPEPRTRGPRQP